MMKSVFFLYLVLQMISMKSLKDSFHKSFKESTKAKIKINKKNNYNKITRIRDDHTTISISFSIYIQTTWRQIHWTCILYVKNKVI
jgi:hypothetical protein